MTKKLLCVVAADCHIEELIWRDRPSLRGDGFYAFEQIIDLSLAKQVPLILAGDIVETLPADTPTSGTIKFIREQLTRMADANLPVYSIYGQHDAGHPSWLSACNSHVQQCDTSLVEIGGINFYFIDYRSSASLKAALESIPTNARVLVAHQHWREIMGGSSYEASLDHVPENIDMLISGDYHRFVDKSVGLQDMSHTTRVLSPGATHMRKTNEPATHYAALVYDDLSVEKFKLNSRIVVQSELTSEQDISDLFEEWPKVLDQIKAKAKKQQLPAMLEKPILVVRDKTSKQFTMSKLKELVGDTAYLFHYPIKDNVIDEVLTEPNMSDTARIRYYLEKECGDDRQLFDLIIGMLDATNPKTFLTEFKAQFLEVNNAAD